jgi:SAM-dependent methyltransferase
VRAIDIHITRNYRFFVPPGFHRKDLQQRYDVQYIREDSWHSHSELSTQEVINFYLDSRQLVPRRLLNAGCGGHAINSSAFEEVRLDLFSSPLVGRSASVCASIMGLPFKPSVFGCVICVGEVLGYCDPALAISEFARVLAPSGLLICDFSSSLSFRHRFTKSFARAADMITDRYNGAPEKIWIYNPEYIRALLNDHGFVVRSQKGTHLWSAVARRVALSPEVAVSIERRLSWLPAPPEWADLATIVAELGKGDSI